MENLNKTIWIFWLSGFADAPQLVRNCADSWKKFNPDYKIIYLDENNYREYVDLPPEIDFRRKDITVQKASVFIRLALLSRYGGVWTDATVYCCRSLDEWLPSYMDNGFFAFRNPGPDRLMSSWFIAAHAGNKIVTELSHDFFSFFSRNRFRNLNNSFGKYAVRRLSASFNTSPEKTKAWLSPFVTKILQVYPYFIIQYIFNHIVLENEKCRELWNSSPALEAADPHILQTFHYARNEDSISNAFEHIDSRKSPVYKLDWRFDICDDYWQQVISHLNRVCP